MRRYIHILIAVMLVAVMTISIPMQAAASSRNTYISEMVIEIGKTEEEVKARLTDAGYNVFDNNISNCDDGDDTYGYMYIGYKTTTDPDEAITDMRLMNMGGGYSYAEYEQLLQQQRENIDLIITRLESAVKEYRINYTNKRKAAVLAYEMLNQLKEDDTGLLMGDYLLDVSKTKTDYVNVFMQCSTAVLLTVENALAIACSATYDRGIRRVSELDSEDFIGEVYYEEIASNIYDDLDSVQTALAIYSESGLTTADGATDEEREAAFAALSEEEFVEWSESFKFAYMLESIELADGTALYDLFMSDLDELTTEELYSIASVFSEGQAAMIPVSGLKNVITAALMGDDEWADIDEAFIYRVDEPISIYTGVDRSLFEGGVALTSKAMVEAAASADDSWLGVMDKDTEDLYYDIMSISAMTLAGAATAMTISYFSWTWVYTGSYLVLKGLYRSAEVQLAIHRCAVLLNCIGYFGIAMFALTLLALGVFLIATAIYLISIGIEYYFPDYDEIPRILVEKSTDEAGFTSYVNYYGVKSLGDKVMDINQHDGSRWVSLYTTKDATAGTPILADMVIQSTNLLNGYQGVCKFSQSAAFNLNKNSYNLDSTVERGGKKVEIGASYLFFKAAEADSNYASIFTGASTLVGIGGLALGVIVGIIGTSLYTKKKKAAAAA